MITKFNNIEYLKILEAIKTRNENKIKQKIDEIRVFFELSRTNDKKIKKFLEENSWEDLEKLLFLLFKYSKRNENYIDFKYINPLLWFLDKTKYKKKLKILSQKEIYKVLKMEPFKEEFYKKDDLKIKQMSKDTNFSVVVFSPNQYSLYSLGIVELLKRNNITINKVYVKNIFSINRFKNELKFGGKKFLKKIWRKLILRKSENKGKNKNNIENYLKENNIKKENIKKWCSKNNIFYQVVDNFNDENVVKEIKEINPTIIVFTGGGILKKQVLMASKIGVLNCHMGILPNYRGMDIIQWAILEKRLDLIGLSCHIMTEKIDEGPIVSNLNIDISKLENIGEKRNLIEANMPKFLLDNILKLKVEAKAYIQKREEGIVYFKMHPLLEKKL